MLEHPNVNKAEGNQQRNFINMKKPFGIIYKIENKVNGKVYIGQTRQPLCRRKGEHVYRFTHKVRDYLIYKAFTKYGLESFTWEVLETCKDYDQLNEAEVAWIAKFSSYHRGYNMTPGGEGVTGSARAKISKKLKGRVITWAHKTVATRRKLGNYGVAPNGPIGKKGSNHPRSTQYIVIEPDGTEHQVDGLRQWCRRWDKETLNHPGLIEVARGRRSNHKGYLCRYADKARSTTISKESTPKRVEKGRVPLGLRYGLNCMETCSGS